jgi:hypothetical protein
VAARAKLVSGALLVVASFAAQANVLARENWLLPLAPVSTGPHFQFPVKGLDPKQSVWVAYRLTAISADAAPEGELQLDAALENVRTDITDLYVTFNAEDLEHSSSSGTIGERLTRQIGKRTPAEMKAVFGPDLHAAYEALNQRRGSILTGTLIKHYEAPGQVESQLLVSIDRSTGMQPVLIEMVLGQGELPEEFRSKGISPALRSGLAVGALALLIAGVQLWRHRNRHG